MKAWRQEKGARPQRGEKPGAGSMARTKDGSKGTVRERCVWLVGLTNALNLIDNMDGLSSGVGLIASFGMCTYAVGTEQVAFFLLALGLSGACIGFLIYNFDPARAFMGDSGSLFLGYMLSVLAVQLYWKEPGFETTRFLAPVLILGYPILDSAYVCISRVRDRRAPWIGGKDHTSHRMVTWGLRSRQVVLAVYAFSFALTLGALRLTSSDLLVFMTLPPVLAIILICTYWLRRSVTG